MVGLVLVTHAGLAQELLNAAETIVGTVPQAVAVGLKPDDPVEGMRDAIAAAVTAVNGEGVIIMTDMFGGTPSNVGLSFLEEGRVEVLTGVNLPMVIQFAMDRSKYDVPTLAKNLKSCGRESISVAGDYLK